MNLKQVYENNKKLDNIFFEKYGDTEEIFRKNCIELLVELGEFKMKLRYLNIGL